MVEFITEKESAIQQTQGIFVQIYTFFADWWMLLVASVVLLILGIIAYYIFVKREEEQKERDEPGYALYKSIKHSAKLNCNPKYIRKTYGLRNLFWFGIPLYWKEHSAKILNMTNELMGYYRGDFVAMDGTWNIMVYKKKYWIFFEDDFIIKMPFDLKLSIQDKKDKTKTSMKVINLRDQIKRLPNYDIKLNCVNLERVGQYYFVPVFILADEKGVLDVRKVMEGAVIDSTNQQMIQRVLNVASKQMEMMAKLNPNLKYAQASPEKTTEERKLDEEN